MKSYLLLLLLCFCSFALNAQSIVGLWKTIDDDDGKEKSYVEIYEENNKFYGKIVKLLDAEIPEKCGQCKGDLKNHPMIGLQIITDIKRDDSEWSGGKILDPANGKEYKCKLSLDGNDTLKVRGFIGFSLIGRTQEWYRVK